MSGPESGGEPAQPMAPAEAERLAREAADLRERWLRARADYENLQRRTARDAALERERQRARTLEAFLPLLELCHMAAHQAGSHPGPLSDGVVLLAREFDRFAAREGLVAVREAGVPFDPAVHEAVAEEAVDGVAPGHVSRVVQPGYRLGDRVLRFAKVAVAPGAAGKP